MIYLDSAATSLYKPLAVGRAMTEALRTLASPGRGSHEPAMRAAELLLDCREEAAALFHVPDPERVVFTSNATHALNIAIRSLVKPGSRVVISGFEHNAVTRPLHALGARVEIAGRRLFEPADTLRAFARALPGADAAVCTQVSNVFGCCLPVAEIAALCREQGVPLIVDASQGAGVLDVDFAGWGAAFAAMPGHKGLLGPQGTGLLLCAEGGEPLLYGGSGSLSRLPTMPEELPDRLEAGTHNVCGIAGLLAGLRYVRVRGTASILAHERRLLALFTGALAESGLELFTGEGQSGVVSLRSPRHDAESLAQRLGERGVCVRGGLHCAPLAHESAGTLETGTVRFSFSPFLDERQVLRAAEILRELEGN